MPLSVSIQVLGRRRPLLADFEVTPPVGFGSGHDVQLRDLIAMVVREQVARFAAQEEARRLDRVLSERASEPRTPSAAVERTSPARAEVADPVQAAATAVRAFEEGCYFVIVDEIERRDLDEPVRLAPDSRLTFVRLAFGAGT